MMNTVVAVQAKAQELLERGAGLYEAGKLYEALACWKRVLEIDPGNEIATEYLRFIEDNFQIGVDAFLAHHESPDAPEHSAGPPAAPPMPEVLESEPLGDLDWSELLDDPDAGALAPPETSLVAAAEDDDEDFFAELEPGSLEAGPSEAADAWGVSGAAASIVNDSLSGESLSADPFQLPASAFSSPFDPLAPPPLPGSGLHGTDPPLPLTDFGRARARSVPPGSRGHSERPRAAGPPPDLPSDAREASGFDFESAAEWPDLDSAAWVDPATSASITPAVTPPVVPPAATPVVAKPGTGAGNVGPAHPGNARSGGPAPAWSERGSDLSLPFVSGDEDFGGGRPGLGGAGPRPSGGLPSIQAAPTPPVGIQRVLHSAATGSAPAAHSPPEPRGDRELSVMSDDSIELMLDSDFKAWETDGLAPGAPSASPSRAPAASGPPSSGRPPAVRGAAVSEPPAPTGRAAAPMASAAVPADAGGRGVGARAVAEVGDIFSSPFDQATPPPRPGPASDDLEDWSSLMGPAGSERPAALEAAESDSDLDAETDFSAFNGADHLAPDPLPFDAGSGGYERSPPEDDAFDFDAAFEALEAGARPPPITPPDAAGRGRPPAPSALETSRAEATAQAAAARAAEDAARIAKAEAAVRSARAAEAARAEAAREAARAEGARAEAARAEAAREAARAEAAREAARAEAARAEAAREAARAEAARAEAARAEAARVEAAREAAPSPGGWGAELADPPRAGINPMRTGRRSVPAAAVAPVAAPSRPAAAPVRPPAAEARMPRATPVPTAPQAARTPAEIEAILRAGLAGLDAFDTPPRPPSAQPRSVPAAIEVDFDALMAEARRRQQAGDFSGSLQLVEQVLAGQPEHAEARRYMEQNTTRLLAMYRSRLGRMAKIPTVKLRPQEIIWQALDHRAGFVLAQVDGLTSYEDIVEISGMSELEATRILARLVEHGVIG